jgi:hypothetical protein
VGRRVRLRKDTDDENEFWCGGGVGIVREEVWVNAKGDVVRYNLAFLAKGDVVRYNLAFLLPHLFGRDHGRVLGFDNAHGVHERHYMGKAEPVVFKDYPATAERFYKEVSELRRSYED